MPDLNLNDSMTEEDLLEMIDFDRLPRHVCIILDGNRRWAKEKGLPVFWGHKQGVETFRKILTAACELGIKVLTVFAFSTENWKRAKEEVDFLMNLYAQYCKSEKQLMKDTNIQFRAIGKLEELPTHVIRAFNEITEYTKDCDRMVLNVCVNYSSRQEILKATLKIAEDIKSGKIDPTDVTEKYFSNYLYTADLPDPDLMIRTSGEFRISNFLLWQNAYSEFWFTNLYWPDFGKRELLIAIIDYQKRERRYGGNAK